VKYDALGRRLWFLSFVVALACDSTVAQGVRTIEHEDVLAPAATDELVLIELQGFVSESAGEPVQGAVVVSSAGGEALTDAAGAYRLAVSVPLGARDVHVTAVGAHGLVASASAALSAASRSAQVPPLVLGLGSACTPSWLPTFGGMGTSDVVSAVAEYDSGAGPELHAAGSFLSAGGVAANRIARWDGSRWKPLGAGLNGAASALVVFDDGSGPALFVAGWFTTAGGAPAARIAKWNGTTWSAVGGGMDSIVQALAVWDDGDGPALYAGGSFVLAGGAAASRIARWNGTSWTTLGTGLSGPVSSLAVHDEGSGPALFVGGYFGTAGGVSVGNIARWNGTSWTTLGSGLYPEVFALAVYDDGSGAALHAGGYFTVTGGGNPSRNVARWTGSSWAPLGDGLNGSVYALHAFDDGSGSKLHVGGSFSRSGFSGPILNNLALWNGSSWHAAGSGMEGGERWPNPTEVMAFCAYDDGGGPALVVGGRFSDANGQDVNNVAQRVGSSFTGFGTGLSGSVRAVALYDDGTGPALYAGGDFVTAEGVTLNHVGKWDGMSWSPLDGGVDGNVHALLVHDDGSGPALFVGGDFVTAGGATVNGIAKWDGAGWSELDRGLTLGGVRALAVHNGALFAGGTFLVAGGQFGSIPVNRIARWNGTAWSSLGSGVNTPGGIVKTLISYDDGNGPRLFAGGVFSSVGWVPVTSIAKWNGSSWVKVGDDFPNAPVSIDAFAVYGGSLHVGGDFDQAGGGIWSGRLARWNGTSWLVAGNGSSQSAFNESVLSLAVHDDGTGAKLYVGGNAGMMRWNGSSWSALGGGALGSVLAMTTFDDGSGPSFFAAGQVFSFVGAGDSFLGEWGCDRRPPVITARPVHAIDRPVNGPGEVVPYSVEVDDDHDPAPNVWFSLPEWSWFPLGTTIVTAVATDAAGNHSFVEFPVTIHEKRRPKRL
jgi:hypothetical protein